MKNKYLKFHGSITLFLCLIFTALLSLIILVLESSRIHAVNTRTEGISHMAMESVLGYFSLPLFENYGLFAVNIPDSSLTPLLDKYVNYNLFPASDLPGAYYNLYKTASYNCTPCKIYHITDSKGEIFVNQVIRYMKYSAVPHTTDILLNSSYINIFFKDYVDISKINTTENQVDTSFPLEDFSGDTADSSTLAEEEALSKRDSIFTRIRSFLNHASLSIYIDKSSDISARRTDVSKLPSIICNYSGHSDSPEFLSGSDKILFLLYLSDNFSCYTSKKSDNTELSYQLEYLIGGAPCDDENLLNSILKIQSLRTGLNLAYLYTDTQKRQAARALAEAAVGLIPVPFIVEFTQLSILSAWSSAEAIVDVRNLLKGNKIPIFKTKNSWTLELDDLLTFQYNTSSKSSGNGFTYAEYIQLFLYTELSTDTIYRTMDLIQMDLRKNYNPDFQMTECITGLKYNFNYNYFPVFHINNLLYQKTSLFHHTFTQSYGY